MSGYTRTVRLPDEDRTSPVINIGLFCRILHVTAVPGWTRCQTLFAMVDDFDLARGGGVANIACQPVPIRLDHEAISL